MKRKRRIPWWARRRVSCPDCGFCYDRTHEIEAMYENKLKQLFIECPRCSCVYSYDEFWELNRDKYSKEAEV